MLRVKAGGYQLAAAGACGDLKWSHQSKGCWEASWTMDLPPYFKHPALRRGQRVEIMEGPIRRWVGELTEPERDPWQLTASGLARKAEKYLCFDSGGNTSSVPNTAVDQAIADGIGWTRTASLSSTAFSAATDTVALNRLSVLLDSWSEEAGKRWTVGADGVIRASVDPTTPSYILTPGSAVLGIADDDYASHLYGRRQSGASTYQTHTRSDPDAEDRWGYAAEPVDLTGLGIITNVRAAAILDGMLLKGKARTGWTNGLEVTPSELRTAGGTPAHLAAVTAGQMVRLHGFFDNTRDLSGKTYLDIVIGETQFTAGEDSIVINPVGLAPRNLTDVFTVQSFRQPIRFGG